MYCAVADEINRYKDSAVVVLRSMIVKNSHFPLQEEDTNIPCIVITSEDQLIIQAPLD